MPADRFVLNAEVSVAFSDEDIEEHVREQTAALKALYLATKQDSESGQNENPRKLLQFVVKRGLQVVGVASYVEETGYLTEVAIRPSAASDRIGETLMDSVKTHAKKVGLSTRLIVNPCSAQSRELFRSMGFSDCEMDESMVAPLD